MRVMGVFNGQVVEAEFFLDFAQQLLVRFEQTDPDKSVLVFELFADVRNHYICHAHALGVGGTITPSLSSEIATSRRLLRARLR